MQKDEKIKARPYMTSGFADYRFRLIFEVGPLTPVERYGASRLGIENFFFYSLHALTFE